MYEEHDLLMAYRELNPETKEFILSTSKTALISQRATLKQIKRQHPEYNILFEPVKEPAAAPIG